MGGVLGGGGGLRPDPLSNVPVPVYKTRSRFAATSLRGFYLLQQAIFPNGMIKRDSGTQAITFNVETLVTFDTVVKDATADEAPGEAEFAMASLGDERLYARIPGWYRAETFIPWAVDITQDELRVRIKKDGTTFIGRGVAGVTTVNTRGSYATVNVQMARDTYIEAWVFQFVEIGGLNIIANDGGPWLSLTWLGL